MTSQKEVNPVKSTNNLVISKMKISINKIQTLLDEGECKRLYFHHQYNVGNTFKLLAYKIGKNKKFIEFLPDLIEQEARLTGNEFVLTNHVVLGHLELTNTQLKVIVSKNRSGYVNVDPKIITINPEYLSYAVGIIEMNPSPPRNPGVVF